MTDPRICSSDPDRTEPNMTDPREEIKRTLIQHYGHDLRRTPAAVDALLPLFLREREATITTVLAFLREPRDSADVNLSLGVAASLIEREFGDV